MTIEENPKLATSFSEEAIKAIVFRSYSDGAPGPDGVPFMFHQVLWDGVTGDLIRMFNAWFEGDLDLFRLNFAMITLVPK